MHRYHDRCLQQWYDEQLMHQHCPTCPLCRADLRISPLKVVDQKREITHAREARSVRSSAFVLLTCILILIWSAAYTELAFVAERGKMLQWLESASKPKCSSWLDQTPENKLVFLSGCQINYTDDSNIVGAPSFEQRGLLVKRRTSSCQSSGAATASST